MRIRYEELVEELKSLFLKYGLSDKQALICAITHAESSRDGIYSHGLNRVPRFIETIENQWVNLDATPTLERDFASIQVYNGNLGIGIMNAFYATDRAMELAEEFGVGLVGLNNTTHWMRGGTYGLHAAAKGYISIMWTNTESNMPAWGGKDAKLGNNPLVMAVPTKSGKPVLLDMAMSQFAYGKLETLILAGEQLPIAGGYDEAGNLTTDPSSIMESRRILPMGYWKGSSLSFMLDIFAAILSAGNTTVDVDNLKNKGSGGYSQVFIVIDPKAIGDSNEIEAKIVRAIKHLRTSELAEGVRGVQYPGEGVLRNRTVNLEKGVYVDDHIWRRILELSSIKE